MEAIKFLATTAVLYGVCLALTAGFAEMRGTDVGESVKNGLLLMIIPAILSATALKLYGRG